MIAERDEIDEDNDEHAEIGRKQRVKEETRHGNGRCHGDEEKRHDKHGCVHAIMFGRLRGGFSARQSGFHDRFPLVDQVNQPKVRY